MTDPIVLYYWPTPNGWKISVALEEFALPYEVRLIDITAGEQHAQAFREVSPNGRIPAITDPDGSDGAPVSIFESGAILQYLARKTGRFGGGSERERIAVDQWLMWQVGGLGPMAGQAHHFLKFAPRAGHVLPYAQSRYRDEVARLYGVMNAALSQRRYLACDDYTIADMACWGWASLWEGQQQTLDDKPHLARWLAEVSDRPAVRRGRAVFAELRP